MGLRKNKFVKKAVVGGLVLLLGGCPRENLPPGLGGGGGTGNEEVESVTGIAGLNTPEEILANENVARLIDSVELKGYDLNLERGTSPPNIEETYIVEGHGILESGLIEPSLLRVHSQTLDNCVDVVYLENDIQGGVRSDIGLNGNVIMRGRDNKFTLYYLTEQNLGGGCIVDFVNILSGQKEKSGSLSAISLSSPVGDYDSNCVVFDSADEVTLTPVRYLLPELGGGGGTGNEEVESVTGIAGLNTPEEILADEEVSRVVGIVRNALNGDGLQDIRGVIPTDQGLIPPRDYSLNLETGSNPPIVEGLYIRSDPFQIYPPRGFTGMEGTIEIRNQTSENYVGMPDFSLSGKGIIRGSENRFTVYYIPSSEYCGDIIRILDGVQNEEGDISAIHFSVPVDVNDCVGGLWVHAMDLEKTE
ncbi:MAG: hypothetical protein KKD94_05385 [Nanoarchaeota archaeon]|nr:hypothetical protein [Nanoarchaeota archaeon]MBU1988884.1 hypothetical protein [Nanoarchaeota archaeon]